MLNMTAATQTHLCEKDADTNWPPVTVGGNYFHERKIEGNITAADAAHVKKHFDPVR